MLNKNLTNNLQIWGFESDIIIFQDGSHGFGLHCHPIDISCWDNPDINSFSERLDIFLNTLPEGINIQFVQDITDGNDQVIENYKNCLNSESTELAKEIANDRYNILKNLDENKWGISSIKHLFVAGQKYPTLEMGSSWCNRNA